MRFLITFTRNNSHFSWRCGAVFWRGVQQEGAWRAWREGGPRGAGPQGLQQVRTCPLGTLSPALRWPGDDTMFTGTAGQAASSWLCLTMTRPPCHPTPRPATRSCPSGRASWSRSVKGEEERGYNQLLFLDYWREGCRRLLLGRVRGPIGLRPLQHGLRGSGGRREGRQGAAQGEIKY